MVSYRAANAEYQPLYSADYDTTHPVETRKYLKTYGLSPPAVETYDTQSKRCKTAK